MSIADDFELLDLTGSLGLTGSSWQNRRFIHIETGEIFRFIGITIDPQYFLTVLAFKNDKNNEKITITNEFYTDQLKGPEGFSKLEEYFSLRPLSIRI